MLIALKYIAMKSKTAVAFISIFLTIWSTSQIMAADDGKSLLGTWEMTEVSGRSWNGAVHSKDSIKSIVLDVTEHDGVTFAGTYSWELSTDALRVDDGQDIVTEAEEIVIGVQDFDGTYIMVDYPDTSIIRIKMVAEDILHMVAYEAGPHAVVSRLVFNRK